MPVHATTASDESKDYSTGNDSRLSSTSESHDSQMSKKGAPKQEQQQEQQKDKAQQKEPEQSQPEFWRNPVQFARQALTYDSATQELGANDTSVLETDGAKPKSSDKDTESEHEPEDDDNEGQSDGKEDLAVKAEPTSKSQRRFSSQGLKMHSQNIVSQFRPTRLLKSAPSLKGGKGWYQGDAQHKHTSTWKDQAPRYVTYGDSYLAKNSYGVPDPNNVKGFQYYNISFFLANGPSDNVKEWAKATMDCKVDIVKKYNKQGIRLGMSVGGADDKPLTNKVNPDDLAAKAADFVITNALQGVDIDFEEFKYFEKGNKKGADFVIGLTKGLRKRLPKDRYYISHAPVAPLFNPKVYKYGYTYVEQQVGGMIDFYNIQYYNQGDYTSKESLVYKSKNNPGTAVLQLMNEQKIPAEKIVVGKPLRQKDATNGYVDAHDLGRWLQHAAYHGWNGGCMWYEYRKEIEKSLEAVTREVHYGKD